MQTQLEEQLSRSRNLPGRLLYCYTHYQISSDVRYRKKTEATLAELSTRVVEEKIADIRTLRGLLLLEAYQDTLIASSCRQELVILDEYLVDQSASWIADHTLNGWYAAAIVGRYFLLRKEHTYLQSLVAAWRNAEKVSAGVVNTNPLLTYEDNTPLGFEGISGLLLLLTDIEQTVHEEAIRKIIREGIRYLLSFRSEVDFSNQQYAVFPQAINGQELVEGVRPLAWGGSDLAQAVLFYRAHTLFQDKQLRHTADLVGLNTLLRKDRKHLLTRDETVFGGAAGVAQTYATLYRLSGHQSYQSGYEYWLREMLISLDTQLLDRYTGRECSLYDGLLGIYLVLLSYQTELKVSWPKALLLE